MSDNCCILVYYADNLHLHISCIGQNLISCYDLRDHVDFTCENRAVFCIVYQLSGGSLVVVSKQCRVREVVTSYDPGLILIKIQYTQWLHTSADYKYVFAVCRLVDIYL